MAHSGLCILEACSKTYFSVEKVLEFMCQTLDVVANACCDIDSKASRPTRAEPQESVFILQVGDIMMEAQF